jgi:hypothetical protein
VDKEKKRLTEKVEEIMLAVDVDPSVRVYAVILDIDLRI